MEKGLSPLDTTHCSWAKSPWLTTSLPKEKGTISGLTAKQFVNVKSYKKKKFSKNYIVLSTEFVTDKSSDKGGNQFDLFDPSSKLMGI